MLEKNQGVFSLYLIDENDNERFVLSTENMVVDNGLDMICSRNGEDLLRRCVVSSDNTEVQPKTNSIPMQVATSGNIISTSAGINDKDPHYFWSRTVFLFEPGQATGNLSKIGITAEDGSIFSVTLFKDSNGKLITIQPRSNERLRVVYEYRVFIDKSDVVYENVVLEDTSDTTYKITIRPAFIYDKWFADRIRYALFIDKRGLSYEDYLRGYNDVISSVDSGPADYIGQAGTISTVPYRLSTFIKSYTGQISWEDFNDSRGIAAIVFHTSRGAYQIGFEPKLKKTDQQKINFTISLEQGR